MDFRKLILAACASLALAATPITVTANDLTIIAPSAPGGGWDQTGRSMQRVLQEHGLAKNIQVINIPGAGGTIGLTQFVNQHKGNPNALLLSGYGTVGAIITSKPKYTLDDVTLIARLTGEYAAVVVPAASPVKNAADLLEAIKADPSKVSFAGGSVGSPDHITAALLGKAAGVGAKDINYIPFAGGGEALASILGGKVTVGISGYGEFRDHIASGALRLIGISSEQRLKEVDAPTFREQGVDVVVQNWRMVAAAPGISEAQKKNADAMIQKMVGTKEWSDVLAKHGWADTYLTGAQFKSFVDSEMSRTGGILKELGLVQ